MDISPTLYQKLTKIKNGAQKAFQKSKWVPSQTLAIADLSGQCYVTIFAFYALIKVSVNVLDIGVFTAGNNFIYLCPIRKLKKSKITGSGTIFQTDFGDKI